MIWLLLVVFQLKHFAADYPLQTPYMLGKFKKSPDFILPLLAHGAVHAAMTFMISLPFVSLNMALALGLLDLAVHCVVDRIKASPELGGRFKALTKRDFEEHQAKLKALEDKFHSLNLDEGIEASAMHSEEQYDWHLRVESNKYFWISLGLDQCAHHLTHYVIIYVLLQ